MNIMVAAAGSQNKWNGYLGVPSHLVKDRSGEAILHRTIRQLRERGVHREEILVLSPPDDRYRHPEVTNVYCDGVTATEFHTSRPYWLEAESKRNILLLGDTWFSDQAVDRILDYEGSSLRFFGRSGPSKLTGSPWGELYAYSWCGISNRVIDDSFLKLVPLREREILRRLTGWELLYNLQGATESQISHQLFPHRTLPEFFTEIDDLTDDLDFARDHLLHPMFGGKR